MASVIYAWEFGTALGHVGTFLPIARELRQRGHRVHWAVTQPHEAAKLLVRENFDWLQAPTLPEQARPGQPINYADILLRFGYANEDQLLGLVGAWRELFRLTKAQVVLADHAPTAILAARSLGLPVMLFGIGFFCPPPQNPTPSLRPWLPTPPQKLIDADAQALAIMNRVLARFTGLPLSYVAELFRVEEPSLLTFPELDHYPNRGAATYWGSIPAAVADPPNWPEMVGPKAFAYLRPELPHFETAIRTLYASQCTVLIYAPGLPDALRDGLRRPGFRFAPSPVDLTKVSQQADIGVTYASPAATVAFLLAGKPVLMIPGQLEQLLAGQRIVAMGAGLLFNPEWSPASLPQLLSQLLTDPVFAANAQGFATKYARFDQNEVMNNIVRRIEAIAASSKAPDRDDS